jgi:hypothetical protein
MSGKKAVFRAHFRQEFKVVDKEEDKLKVSPVKPCHFRLGWVKMENVLYLPIPIKDKDTKVFQKVLFPYNINNILENRVEKFKFYTDLKESPDIEDPDAPEINSIPFAYVYALRKNSGNNSDYLLVGSFPPGKSAGPGNGGISKFIYGWVKKSRYFLWKTRKALVPNPNFRFPPYIFLSAGKLKKFYSDPLSPDKEPDVESLDILVPRKMVKLEGWPILLVGEKLDNCIRLFSDFSNYYQGKIVDKRYYAQHLGYAKTEDPRAPGCAQFLNIYVFKKTEMEAVINDLQEIEAIISQHDGVRLAKRLIEKIGGPRYSYSKTLNEYAREKFGLTYKNLKALFDNPPRELAELQKTTRDNLGRSLRKMVENLKSLCTEVNGRTFGPKGDLYLWIFEEELP